MIRRGLTLSQTQTKKPYNPHNPTPKQQTFLALNCREALYGGAAGGGKSDALLMAALQYVDTPGYAAILFRRTYSDLSLPGALMDRADDWLRGTDAKWHGTEKTWAFPSGASISFGYLDNDAARYRYQGSEFSFIGFDELTQFSEVQYRYLFSRLRRKTGSEIPLRMRAASNPGGVGHEWVKERFILEGESAGRVFVPAGLSDNPHLDREEYEGSLSELDPTTRLQLLAGDWDTLPPGDVFKREWFAGKGVSIEAVPHNLRRVRHWDTAATEPSAANRDPDWTAGVLMGYEPVTRQVYILDVQHFRKGPGDTKASILAQAGIDGRDVTVSLEQEGGSSGKMAADDIVRSLAGFTVKTTRPTGDKVTRARPLASQAQAGAVSYVEAPWNRAYFDELQSFPGGSHDDMVDGSSGAFNELTTPSGQPLGIPMTQSNYLNQSASVSRPATFGRSR